MQSSRQLVPVELRIVARTRDGGHIDQSLYIVRSEKTYELRHRARRMAYRHDSQRYRSFAVFHAAHGITPPET
jgi:hypothetical protein